MTEAARAGIVATGLACPVGLHSRAALAAIRAGIVRFVELDGSDGPGIPVRASMLASIDRRASRVERAAALTEHALREALRGLDPRRVPTLPCFVALPEPGRGAPLPLDELMSRLQPGRRVHDTPGVELRVVQALAAGRAGSFAMMAAALEFLADRGETLALVLGVDSLVDPNTLDELAADNLLLGERNLDGIIPGEGAACVLLNGQRGSSRLRVLADVLANVAAREPLPFARAREQVSGAEGLTRVFGALRAATEGRVDRVFAGTTGQAYFGREFAHAYLREASMMPEPLRCEPLAHDLGDVGAAAGAITMVQATATLTTQRTALAYASSDDGLVGGCIVARPAKPAT